MNCIINCITVLPQLCAGYTRTIIQCLCEAKCWARYWDSFKYHQIGREDKYNSKKLVLLYFLTFQNTSLCIDVRMCSGSSWYLSCWFPYFLKLLFILFISKQDCYRKQQDFCNCYVLWSAHYMKVRSRYIYKFWRSFTIELVMRSYSSLFSCARCCFFVHV